MSHSGTTELLQLVQQGLFWSLWGLAQAALTVGLSRHVLFGSVLNAGPSQLLARIRRSARRGDWARVESACRRTRGPFARFTLLFLFVRDRPEHGRQRVLGSAISSLLAHLDAQAKVLLLFGTGSLVAGLLGGGLTWLGAPATDPATRWVAVGLAAWPPLMGCSVGLACLGASWHVRGRLEGVAADLELLRALLENWWAQAEEPPRPPTPAAPWVPTAVGPHLPPFSLN